MSVPVQQFSLLAYSGLQNTQAGLQVNKSQVTTYIYWGVQDALAGSRLKKKLAYELPIQGVHKAST